MRALIIIFVLFVVFVHDSHQGYTIKEANELVEIFKNFTNPNNTMTYYKYANTLTVPLAKHSLDAGIAIYDLATNSITVNSPDYAALEAMHEKIHAEFGRIHNDIQNHDRGEFYIKQLFDKSIKLPLNVLRDYFYLLFNGTSDASVAVHAKGFNKSCYDFKQERTAIILGEIFNDCKRKNIKKERSAISNLFRMTLKEVSEKYADSSHKLKGDDEKEYEKLKAECYAAVKRFGYYDYAKKRFDDVKKALENVEKASMLPLNLMQKIHKMLTDTRDLPISCILDYMILSAEHLNNSQQFTLSILRFMRYYMAEMLFFEGVCKSLNNNYKISYEQIKKAVERIVDSMNLSANYIPDKVAILKTEEEEEEEEERKLKASSARKRFAAGSVIFYFFSFLFFYFASTQL